MARPKDAFAAPRFQALYRVWRERGDSVVQASVSPALADVIARRVGQLECRLLTHRYRHLSPCWPRREAAVRGKRQGKWRQGSLFPRQRLSLAVFATVAENWPRRA